MKLRVCDFMSTGQVESLITVYPQNDIVEIGNIMLDMGIHSAKVALSPWNKECIGILEFNKIKEYCC